MKPKSVAIVGAAETTELGRIPDLSQIGLHADAALNAMKDAGIGPKDIDGVATAGETPVTIANYLGITPKWVDGTAVGGCSFMIHVRHAAAAIECGLCKTVLDHAWRKRPLRGGALPPGRVARKPAGSVRAALRTDGAADPLHYPGAALHEDLRHDRGAARDGGGHSARMGREEPARDVQGPDHGRGRADLTDDRVSVPPIDVLPRNRRWRRADPDRLPTAPGISLGSRSTCSAPANWSRRRWSVRWRILRPRGRFVWPGRPRSRRRASLMEMSIT